MHPNRAFDWGDRETALRFAADRAFAHVFTSSGEGMFVVHVPILVTDDGRVLFHISRRNTLNTDAEGRLTTSCRANKGS